MEGEWLELAGAHERHLFAGNSSIETRYVDAFYNLEVDGDAPGASAHAYMVSGVVASGNGDNTVLNTRFPRQNVWKQLSYDAQEVPQVMDMASTLGHAASMTLLKDLSTTT